MRRYNYEKQVEKWDVLEVTVEGHSDKNPFVDYEIQGIFTGKHETVTVDGFYDGEGVYKVRYMPSFVELYTFEVTGSAIDGEVLTGKFQVTPASEENHGPIRVANTYHFAYEDGAPYYSIGTTCYVWAERGFRCCSQKGILPLKKRRHCFYVKNITESNGAF